MTSRILLSLMRFTPTQLDKLQAVSADINVQQITDATFDTLPNDIRNKVEILYGWGNPLREAHRFPKLKWIQTHSAGINQLLNTPVWESEVIISSANGVHSVQMAEHALALMLAFRWRVRQMIDLQTKNEWPKGRWDIFAGPELRGATLGIVGYGAIGRELARSAQALGMRILAVNSSGKRSPFNGFSPPHTGDPTAAIPAQIYPVSQLHTMLPQCDYVVVLTPLTDDTRHLFNADTFAAMNPDSYFFNLARGEVVDEPALIEALKNGLIAGAGLDVFTTEPLPAESPLWNLDNVIISPHVAGFSPLYDERASDLFAENLRRYLNGQTLLNQVNKNRGY